jgi:hypothetical protein
MAVGRDATFRASVRITRGLTPQTFDACSGL